MIARIFRPPSFIYFFIICLIYLIVFTPAPGISLADAGHDDGLFMQWSISILDWQWLGPWNALTTAKAPLHSLLTAVAASLGVNPFLYRRIFYLFGSLVFVLTALKKAPVWFRILTMVALLLDPFQFSPVSLRNLREGTYVPLQLMAFGFGSLSLDYLQKKYIDWRKFSAAIAATSASFGLILITREARVIAWLELLIWLLLGVLVVALRTRGKGKKNLLVTALHAFLSIFIIIGIARIPVKIIAIFNDLNYQAEISNSIEEGAFPRFYGKLISIGQEDEPFLPRVPVSQSLLTQIINESGGQRTLGNVLKNLDPGWKRPGCEIYPQICSEYGGGWFMWALRESIVKEITAIPEVKASEISFQKIVKSLENELDDICRRSTKIICNQARVGYFPSLDRWGFENPIMESANEGVRILSLVAVPSIYPIGGYDLSNISSETRHHELATPLGIPSAKFIESTKWHRIFKIASIIGIIAKCTIVALSVARTYLIVSRSRPIVSLDLVSIWMLISLTIHILVYTLLGLTSFPGDGYVVMASPIFISLFSRFSACTFPHKIINI